MLLLVVLTAQQVLQDPTFGFDEDTQNIITQKLGGTSSDFQKFLTDFSNRVASAPRHSHSDDTPPPERVIHKSLEPTTRIRHQMPITSDMQDLARVQQNSDAFSSDPLNTENLNWATLRQNHDSHKSHFIQHHHQHHHHMLGARPDPDGDEDPQQKAKKDGEDTTTVTDNPDEVDKGAKLGDLVEGEGEEKPDPTEKETPTKGKKEEEPKPLTTDQKADMDEVLKRLENQYFPVDLNHDKQFTKMLWNQGGRALLPLLIMTLSGNGPLQYTTPIVASILLPPFLKTITGSPITPPADDLPKLKEDEPSPTQDETEYLRGTMPTVKYPPAPPPPPIPPPLPGSYENGDEMPFRGHLLQLRTTKPQQQQEEESTNQVQQPETISH